MKSGSCHHKLAKHNRRLKPALDLMDDELPGLLHSCCICPWKKTYGLSLLPKYESLALYPTGKKRL